MAKRYSNEQVDRAKSIDLEQFLSRRGETLKPVGSESKWIYRDASGTHDSVTVKNNKWYDHKRQQGGDSIGFLQEFMGLSFREAIEELLCGEQANELFVKNERSIHTLPQTKKDFVIPDKADNMRKLYAYLTKTRFIAPEIITHFVKAKILYQEATHNNIVFLGLDENGVARAGQKKSTNASGSYKGTLTGSDSNYGFCHKGTGNKLYTFEAPIDMLSYLTIYPGQMSSGKSNPNQSTRWQEQSYIALDGLSPKAMFHFLQMNPQINEINICIDFDEAGIEAYDKHRDLLIEAGYRAENIRRMYPVYKDWNESLKLEHGINPVPAQPHPKIESYRENMLQLCEFYKNSEQNYGQRFADYYDKKGLQGVTELITLEFTKFQQSMDYSKITKVKSRNAHEHLLRMANFCVMALTEMKCQENKSQESTTKSPIYKTVIQNMFDSYKPYTDKGKLKNHCSDLEQRCQALKKSFTFDCEKELASAILRNFADTCMRTKVYIETKYEQDLAQQESFLYTDPQRTNATITEPSEDTSIKMV